MNHVLGATTTSSGAHRESATPLHLYRPRPVALPCHPRPARVALAEPAGRERLDADRTDPRIGRGRFREQGRRVVGRPIVDHDGLELDPSLRAQPRERAPECLDLVPRGEDDPDPRGVGGGGVAESGQGRCVAESEPPTDRERGPSEPGEGAWDRGEVGHDSPIVALPRVAARPSAGLRACMAGASRR